jgi:GNAT superfamily N-acetyltransferase
MTGRLYASELFLWVEPEHRGSGVRLIRRGEQWARDQGAEFMHLVSPSRAVNALYERLGYTQVETEFQRPLTTHTQRASVRSLAHTR